MDRPPPNGFLQISTTDHALGEKIKSQGYCLTDTDVPKVVAINRHLQVLVRTGSGRFLCPVDNVTHFIGIIEEHAKLKRETECKMFQGDYIRDVSLPCAS